MVPTTNTNRSSHRGFRVGMKVLASMPVLDDDRNDNMEVVTVRAFASRDGVMRAQVEDDDGVMCWIKAEMIARAV